MNSLWFSLAGPYFEPLGWALVHFLWQGAVVALLLAAVLQCLAQATSSKRYLAGCIGLAIMAICPIVTLGLGVTRQAAWSEPRETSAERSPEQVLSTHDFLNRGGIFAQADLDAPRDIDRLATTDPVSVQPAPTLAPNARSTILFSWLVGIWALGVCILSLRLCASWIWIQRMKGLNTLPIPEEWSRVLTALARQMEISRPVRILQSALVEVPTLIGWLRPTILLPLGFLTGMTPRQVEAILAHEFAHILRRDYLVNLLQTLVETVLFYHPAVWWVSRFIRSERENCCDDIAALECGEPVEYARALTALEGFRATHRHLVVAANHGSLLQRIRRLAGLRDSHADRPTLWAIPILLLLLAPFVLPWSHSLAAISQTETSLPAAVEEPGIAWGAPIKGLQCRILPLPSSIDSEATDFSKTSSIFGDSQEITFGVELKNVGDKPLQLPGVRYGDSYGPSSGKWNADSLAPFLFQFEFLDGTGVPLARAERSYVRPITQLSGVSVHEILPGQSFKAVLRPGRFSGPMAYRVPAGAHQVRLRYLGISEDILVDLKKHWPNKPIAQAWTGPVLSNTVSFEIKAPGAQDQPREPAWGPATRGLCAAVQFRPRNGAGSFEASTSVIPFNTVVEPHLLIKNAGKEPISFVSETWRQDDRIFVKDPQGNETELQRTWYSGWPTLVQWRLKPGEIASLDSSPLAFLDNPQAEKKLDQPVGKTILAKKGTYQIRVAIHLGGVQVRDPQAKNEAPANRDWTGVVETAAASLTIRDREPADGAQVLRDINLDSWRILRLTGKSIGLATQEDGNETGLSPLRIVVEGPGSMLLGPLASKEPSPSAASGPTVRAESANGISWEKGGQFRFKGKVKVDFLPREAQDGPAFQMVCDELELDSAPGKAGGTSSWSVAARGQIRWTSKEIQAQAARLHLDWSRQTLILEGPKEQPARLIMTKGEGEISATRIQVNLKQQTAQIEQARSLVESPPRIQASADEKLRWNWKGLYPGRLLFVDPLGKPIPQGTFSARLIRKQEPSAQGALTGSPLTIPDCDGQPLAVTVRAPGFEERVFADIDLKPGEVKKIELVPAAAARLRVVSAVDKKPLKGAKVRFFNKSSDQAGGGPYPMQGIEGPIWQTTQEDGVATLDVLQKVDPNYPKLGDAVYFFYVEPPDGATGLLGRFVGPVRSGVDLGTIELSTPLEVHGEVRGTKEELDRFAAEWDQPFEQVTANPQAKFSYAVSKDLETSREGDCLHFHLKNLSPGKLRIVANFDPHPHSVSHVYTRREAKGNDLEMSVEVKRLMPKLIITAKGLKKEI